MIATKFTKATPISLRNANKVSTLLEHIRLDPHMVDPLAGQFDPLNVYLGERTGHLCYAAWYYDMKSLKELVRRTVAFTGEHVVDMNTDLGPKPLQTVVTKCVEAVLIKARKDLPAQLNAIGE